MTVTSLTLAEARAAIRAGELSPLELTEAFLARIEALNPRLNAYLLVTAETAIAEARAATEAIPRGGTMGPLHGIPVALKDLFDVRGLPTTAGSILFRDNIASQDAFVTQCLRRAGAVLLGKLNLHEWAFGATAINPYFGACCNPWDTDRIAGGSSGGSGAALAAGLCLGSVGTDTGGSIRVPASLCGIVGLKPTYGRVSVRGVVPVAWSLDHVGPMARTVQDAGILLQTIAGYDPDDPYSGKEPVGEFDFDAVHIPLRAKVGVPDQTFLSGLHAETESAFRAATATLAELGCVMCEGSIAGHATATEATGKIMLAEAAAFHQDRIRDHADRFGPDVLPRLRAGQAVTGPDYALARRVQMEWRQKMRQLFETIDLLVLPATPIPAPPISESAGPNPPNATLVRFTRLFNLTGNPACVLPCGFSSSGLPIGLQVVGPEWGEAKVLQLAHAFESVTPWHKRTPY